MEIEEIKKVEILDSGELYIILSSGGKPSYEYIYREAAEVYWDNERKGFKSPVPREWSYTDWYRHIVKVAGSCNISLVQTENTEWVNVPDQLIKDVCTQKNT